MTVVAVVVMTAVMDVAMIVVADAANTDTVQRAKALLSLFFYNFSIVTASFEFLSSTVKFSCIY
jgi:hypothetical protein